MSTLNHLFDLPNQICYVQCEFCTTILMVSVPCCSLSMVVTVRCGHCTTLLYVNMKKASFIPFHHLASLAHLQEKDSNPVEDASKSKTLGSHNASIVNYFDCQEDDIIPMINIVNKPPEKRQRTPSAYNRFIKEEIRRLKAENPDMAHKEAFSRAAKNWANFPRINWKGDKESCSQTEKSVDLDSQEAAEHERYPLRLSTRPFRKFQVNGEDQSFQGRKVPRNSILGRTPSEGRK